MKESLEYLIGTERFTSYLIPSYRLKRLNQMKASDELTPEDVRQLSFDLENSLAEFHRVLASTK